MPAPTKIFIIPYRNRVQHKTHFDIYMKYILEDIPKHEYEIFFVHQQDNKPFNRGAMKNIGFLAMKDKYPQHYKNITFIFNDVDTVPYRKNLLNYNTNVGTVKHFFGFHFALGGIVSIKGSDFEKTGGFPNNWGWGIEDNTMNRRVVSSGIKIDRSVFFPVLNHNIIHVTDGVKRMLTKEEVWRYDEALLDTFRDIKNLVYKIENEFIQVSSFTTKYSHNSQTYYTSNSPGLIQRDKRFIPKDTTAYRFGKLQFR